MHSRMLTVTDSSNIESIWWDPQLLNMQVNFKNRSNGTDEYHYKDIQPEIFALLASANSVGKAFNAMKLKPT